MYILIVDNDRYANRLVQFTLSKEGYEVETIDNCSGAFQMLEKREPDLLILEVSMPIDGFKFVRKLRDLEYKIPFIFMTDCKTIQDKVEGFQLGAEDYICKPFEHQELVMRTQAVLRRVKMSREISTRDGSICVGNIELLPDRQKVIVQGHTINLTRTATEVLRILMENANQIVPREQLFQDVWHDENGYPNLVDVTICRLRSKIEVDPKKPRHILTVRHYGYKFWR